MNTEDLFENKNYRQRGKKIDGKICKGPIKEAS